LEGWVYTFKELNSSVMTVEIQYQKMPESESLNALLKNDCANWQNGING